MLQVKNVYSGYNNVDIVKDISLSVERGNNLYIIGPNGCGKSTLLKSIANLLDYKGDIYIDNKSISDYSRKELAKKIGLMTQVSNIHFPYTVYETVSLGRYAYLEGIFTSLSRQDHEIILNSLEQVNLVEYKDTMIDELSGGQLQRVFLARIMTQNPDIILLDEPTNHLDLKHQIELLENLSKWAKENNKIVIGVLHDLNLVQYFADEVLLLEDGKVKEYGKPSKVLKKEILKEVYDIDVKEFMINVLNKWTK